MAGDGEVELSLSEANERNPQQNAKHLWPAVTTIRDGKYWRGHVAQGLEIISTQSRGLLYSLKQEVDEMHKKATQRLDALEQKQRLSNLIIKTGSSNEAPPCSSVRFLRSRPLCPAPNGGVLRERWRQAGQRAFTETVED